MQSNSKTIDRGPMPAGSPDNAHFASLKTNWAQFGALVSVFFFWGFIAASNDILIPVFQEAFSLSPTASQFVSLAFYVAYTVGSVIYVCISKMLGVDILNCIGYKNGICLGLLISAVGTSMFYLAAQSGTLNLMLSGLFVVGLGFSLQQIAANPLAIVLGDIKTSSQRLILAGGVNNLGTTIGPLLVSLAIFGHSTGTHEHVAIDSVKTPYLVLTLAFVAVAIILKLSSLPNHIAPVIHNDDNKSTGAEKKSAFHYPQLVGGMLAIFFYVGVEVATASNLPQYLRQNLGVLTQDVAPYISLYWASLMMGRWTGAVGVFETGENIRKLLKFVTPYLAFCVFLAVNAIAGHHISQFFVYVFVVIAMVVADLLSKGNPAKILLYFSICAICALIIGMNTSGIVSAYSFISVGLFCSALWPCIFTLALSGLGKNMNQGSSLLIMMIMGGGIVSTLQGVVAAHIGIQASYIVGVGCFVYLAAYAIFVTRTLRKQGISLDHSAACLA